MSNNPSLSEFSHPPCESTEEVLTMSAFDTGLLSFDQYTDIRIPTAASVLASKLMADGCAEDNLDALLGLEGEETKLEIIGRITSEADQYAGSTLSLLGHKGKSMLPLVIRRGQTIERGQEHALINSVKSNAISLANTLGIDAARDMLNGDSGWEMAAKVDTRFETGSEIRFVNPGGSAEAVGELYRGQLTGFNLFMASLNLPGVRERMSDPHDSLANRLDFVASLFSRVNQLSVSLNNLYLTANFRPSIYKFSNKYDPQMTFSLAKRIILS